MKKRESKRAQKNESEINAKLLESYNDLKSIFENKELPSRQVYLRRIGLGIMKTMPDLYRYPILQSIEETSKIMLINEIEAGGPGRITEILEADVDGAVEIDLSDAELRRFADRQAQALARPPRPYQTMQRPCRTGWAMRRPSP